MKSVMYHYSLNWVYKYIFVIYFAQNCWDGSNFDNTNQKIVFEYNISTSSVGIKATMVLWVTTVTLPFLYIDVMLTKDFFKIARFIKAVKK